MLRRFSNLENHLFGVLSGRYSCFGHETCQQSFCLTDQQCQGQSSTLDKGQDICHKMQCLWGGHFFMPFVHHFTQLFAKIKKNLIGIAWFWLQKLSPTDNLYLERHGQFWLFLLLKCYSTFYQALQKLQDTIYLLVCMCYLQYKSEWEGKMHTITKRGRKDIIKNIHFQVKDEYGQPVQKI